MRWILLLFVLVAVDARTLEERAFDRQTMLLTVSQKLLTWQPKWSKECCKEWKALNRTCRDTFALIGEFEPLEQFEVAMLGEEDRTTHMYIELSVIQQFQFADVLMWSLCKFNKTRLNDAPDKEWLQLATQWRNETDTMVRTIGMYSPPKPKITKRAPIQIPEGLNIGSYHRYVPPIRARTSDGQDVILNAATTNRPRGQRI